MVLKANFKHWSSKNKHELFFVVPFGKNKLGVISQHQRDYYNKMAMKHGFKRLSHNELIKASYYCTGKIVKLK